MLLKKLYIQNNLSKSKQHNTLKIPNIIHQIWFGGNLPPEYLRFQSSWQSNHPKWQYIFWTEEKIETTFNRTFYNQKLFDQSYKNGNFAKAADIARYEILHKFGGLYTDFDSQCFRSFDILNKGYAFYAGLEHLNNGLVIGNAIMGARPEHPILKQCMLKIKEYETKKISLKLWKGLSGYTPKVEKEYATTLVTTGPILLSHAIWENMQHKQVLDPECIIFPPTFFYPFAEHMPFIIKSETFACHFFKGLWKKKLKLKYEHNN